MIEGKGGGSVGYSRPMGGVVGEPDESTDSSGHCVFADWRFGQLSQFIEGDLGVGDTQLSCVGE